MNKLVDWFTMRSMSQDELQRGVKADQRLQRGFMLTIMVLGCVAAVAPFFVKDHMGSDPQFALGVLLIAPSMILPLLGREVGPWTQMGQFVGWALWLLHWLGW